MPRKSRDYRAEYAQRLTRAFAKNLTRAQARGHGKTLLRPKSGKALGSDHRYLEKGVRLIRSGESLASAAKQIHVSSERLRNFLESTDIGRKVQGRWRIKPDDRIRQMQVYSGGREHKVKVEVEAASVIGGYLNDVRNFLNSNNAAYLKIWRGKSVQDVRGRKYPFETDPNTLYRLNDAGRSSFDEIYRVIT